MAIMISELYDALLAAGAPEDKARKAAETLAGFETRFSKIESDLHLLKWMTGATAAIVVAGFGVVARLVVEVLARLPAA